MARCILDRVSRRLKDLSGLFVCNGQHELLMSNGGDAISVASLMNIQFKTIADNMKAMHELFTDFYDLYLIFQRHIEDHLKVNETQSGSSTSGFTITSREVLTQTSSIENIPVIEIADGSEEDVWTTPRDDTRYSCDYEPSKASKLDDATSATATAPLKAERTDETLDDASQNVQIVKTNAAHTVASDVTLTSTDSPTQDHTKEDGTMTSLLKESSRSTIDEDLLPQTTPSEVHQTSTNKSQQADIASTVPSKEASGSALDEGRPPQTIPSEVQQEPTDSSKQEGITMTVLSKESSGSAPDEGHSAHTIPSEVKLASTNIPKRQDAHGDVKMVLKEASEILDNVKENDEDAPAKKPLTPRKSGRKRQVLCTDDLPPNDRLEQTVPLEVRLTSADNPTLEAAIMATILPIIIVDDVRDADNVSNKKFQPPRKSGRNNKVPSTDDRPPVDHPAQAIPSEVRLTFTDGHTREDSTISPIIVLDDVKDDKDVSAKKLSPPRKSGRKRKDPRTDDSPPPVDHPARTASSEVRLTSTDGHTREDSTISPIIVLDDVKDDKDASAKKLSPPRKSGRKRKVLFTDDWPQGRGQKTSSEDADLTHRVMNLRKRKLPKALKEYVVKTFNIKTELEGNGDDLMDQEADLTGAGPVEGREMRACSENGVVATCNVQGDAGSTTSSSLAVKERLADQSSPSISRAVPPSDGPPTVADDEEDICVVVDDDDSFNEGEERSIVLSDDDYCNSNDDDGDEDRCVSWEHRYSKHSCKHYHPQVTMAAISRYHRNLTCSRNVPYRRTSSERRTMLITALTTTTAMDSVCRAKLITYDRRKFIPIGVQESEITTSLEEKEERRDSAVKAATTGRAEHLVPSKPRKQSRQRKQNNQTTPPQLLTSSETHAKSPATPRMRTLCLRLYNVHGMHSMWSIMRDFVQNKKAVLLKISVEKMARDQLMVLCKVCNLNFKVSKRQVIVVKHNSPPPVTAVHLQKAVKVFERGLFRKPKRLRFD